MRTTNYYEFSCKGHRIQVVIDNSPDQWMVGSDTSFTVLVDGCRMVLPELLSAYKMEGVKGIELVVAAALDGTAVVLRDGV